MHAETAVQWFAFEDRDKYRFENEPVKSCYLSKVLYCFRGRNAWNGKWSSQVLGRPFFSVESAKDAIEFRRAQGSHWEIHELPAIVVAGDKWSLLFGEFNRQNPLSSFFPLRKPLLTIEDYGTHFRYLWNIFPTFRILNMNDFVTPARLPFFRHHLYAETGYRGWMSSREKQDLLDPVLKLIARINCRLQCEPPRGMCVRT